MGFGICVIGCIALVTDIIGGGIVAYPLLAYGMKKASTLNVNFFYAAVAALFCIPHSALVLFSFSASSTKTRFSTKRATACSTRFICFFTSFSSSALRRSTARGRPRNTPRARCRGCI